MITFAKPCASAQSHDQFLAMLPKIRAYARRAFCAFDYDAQEELAAEVIANAFCAFQRLVERGKADVGYAIPLARYAIMQVRAGRRVGAKLNIRDVSSRHAQLSKGIAIERLDQIDDETGEWQEVLVEDRHAGPAETAASRIDVAAWFRSLGRRKRRIAKTLAHGETTKATAKQFGVSPGRVSQLRREFYESWQALHGELSAA